ncbi:MAG: helix-turn-helix transcriptional regulator [Limisphaerales bacterium]
MQSGRQEPAAAWGQRCSSRPLQTKPVPRAPAVPSVLGCLRAQAAPQAARLLAAVVAKIESSGYEPLTPTEEAVMTLLLTERHDQQVAAALGIQTKTAQTHMENVRRKCRVSSRAGAAVIFALRTLSALCLRGYCPGLRCRMLEASAAPEEAHAGEKPGVLATLAAILTPAFEESCARLTAREQAVLGLLLSGAGDKEIAVSLEITVSTVRSLLARARGRLGAPTRTSAAARFALATLLGCCGTGDCEGLRRRLEGS